MNRDKIIDELKVTDPNTVLNMQQVDKKGWGKREQKRIKAVKIWLKPLPLFDLWMDVGKLGVKEFKQMKIEIKDTTLDRYQTQDRQQVHVRQAAGPCRRWGYGLNK